MPQTNKYTRPGMSTIITLLGVGVTAVMIGIALYAMTGSGQLIGTILPPGSACEDFVYSTCPTECAKRCISPGNCDGPGSCVAFPIDENNLPCNPGEISYCDGPGQQDNRCVVFCYCLAEPVDRQFIFEIDPMTEACNCTRTNEEFCFDGELGFCCDPYATPVPTGQICTNSFSGLGGAIMRCDLAQCSPTNCATQQKDYICDGGDWGTATCDTTCRTCTGDCVEEIVAGINDGTNIGCDSTNIGERTSVGCICPSSCGDGVTDDGTNGTNDLGEACDDGKQCESDASLHPSDRTSCTEDADCTTGACIQFEDDFCDNNCAIDTWVCNDGDIDFGEECDDGGNIDGDGCSATCLNESECGNGQIDDGEDCETHDDCPGLIAPFCSKDCQCGECCDFMLSTMLWWELNEQVNDIAYDSVYDGNACTGGQCPIDARDDGTIDNHSNTYWRQCPATTEENNLGSYLFNGDNYITEDLLMFYDLDGPIVSLWVRSSDSDPTNATIFHLNENEYSLTLSYKGDINNYLHVREQIGKTTAQPTTTVKISNTEFDITQWNQIILIGGINSQNPLSEILVNGINVTTEGTVESEDIIPMEKGFTLGALPPENGSTTYTNFFSGFMDEVMLINDNTYNIDQLWKTRNDSCDGICGDGDICDHVMCTSGPNGGIEECDDGGFCPFGIVPCTSTDDCTGIGDESCTPQSGDGCDDQCQIEQQEPVCGNGIPEAGEDCDDGKTCIDGTDCNSDPSVCTGKPNDQECKVRNNDTCPNDTANGGNCSAPVSCGDGFTCEVIGCTTGPNGSIEECDDENTVHDDRCTNSCALPACGDGIIQDERGGFFAGIWQFLTAALLPYDETDPLEEDCDDGNQNINDACPDGTDGTCKKAFCGDGFVCSDASCTAMPDDIEQCDEGVANSEDPNATCRTDCLVRRCGDGIVDDEAPWNELCDHGTENGLPNKCNTTCDGVTTPVCGNGVPEFGETCDDGNHNNNDDCPDDVTNGGTCIIAICGDDFLCSDTQTCRTGPNGGREICEDNSYCATNEACDNHCNCIPDNVNYCGDGIPRDGEVCDDGNQNNNDSCPDGQGGTCIPSFCGDGFLCDNLITCNTGPGGQTEECDDGDNDDNDGCSAICAEELGICFNTIDEDVDFHPDYPADLGCLVPQANSELQDQECFDEIDNDGDGAIDFDDFSCRLHIFSGETRPHARCDDGKDNDGDGLNDLADPDCTSAQDHSEVN